MHERVQTFQQSEDARVVLKIERQGVALLRKRQGRKRDAAPHRLQHGEKRPLPRSSDTLQDLFDDAVSVLFRNKALVLQKPSLAVNPIPVANAVERIEKLVVGDDALHGLSRPTPVVQGVESAHREGVQQKGGGVARNGDASLFFDAPSCSLGVLGEEEHAATQLSASRKTIDPRDRIGRLGISLQQVCKLTKVARTLARLKHRDARHALHAERELEDNSQKSHSAANGVKQVGVLAPRAGDDRAIREHDAHVPYVASKTSFLVMIFAVNIAGDSSAQRHIPCPR